MFGDDVYDDSPRQVIRICCGPRCGAETHHRKTYAAVEAAVRERNGAVVALERQMTIRPVMCQGHCGMGVTFVAPDGEIAKISAPPEAREKIMSLGD